MLLEIITLMAYREDKYFTPKGIATPVILQPYRIMTKSACFGLSR